MSQKVEKSNKQNHPRQDRLAIKGFQWLSSEIVYNDKGLLRSKGFRNFRVEDEKKKWKIKNCQSFQGIANRIKEVLMHDKKIEESNTKEIKQKLFDKTLEEIAIKGKLQKMNKLKKVGQIYDKEKKLRAAVIQNYFAQEIDWINNRT